MDKNDSSCVKISETVEKPIFTIEFRTLTR